jgi:formate hydrogenlyase subunit 3/multisubunit Na+/H+ antiporter MnhD subunit
VGKDKHAYVKSIALNLLLIVLTALFSLPFLALYVWMFLGLGGSWAYAGPNGCHFVIGPLGYAMLLVPTFGLSCVAWTSLRRLHRRI